MEEQLERLIEKAIEVAEKTGEFAIEQAPLLLQEFYAWHMVLDIMMMSLILIPFITIYASKLIMKDKGDKWPWTVNYYGKIVDDELGFAMYSMTIIMFIAFGVVFVVYLVDLVKLIVAPKLYLLDYFIK